MGLHLTAITITTNATIAQNILSGVVTMRKLLKFVPMSVHFCARALCEGLQCGISSISTLMLWASVVLLAFVIGGCAHGKFVGTNYVPTKNYPGDELPDTRLASVGSGVHLGPKSGSAAVINGEIWFVVLTAVDGKECGCTSVVQILPGKHTFGVKLQSSPHVAGGYTLNVHWKETKPFNIEGNLEQGVAYNLVAITTPDGKPVVILKKLCASSDHIDTVKAFQQWGELVCK
jgi:hypothetical protein